MPAPPALVCLDGVTPRAVEWLWHPYLARGKLALLDGDPGAGKSFLTVDLAARLSRGGPLPDGGKVAGPRNTLFLNAEDDLEDTVFPRLDAAGADLGRVFALGGLRRARPAGEAVQFPRDLYAVQGVVQSRRIDLVVVDPMMAYFPPEVSTNNDQMIRQALTPLAALAAYTGAAVLVVRHLNKSGGPRAMYRGAGSIGIVGAIRTALLVGRNPDDPGQRVLAVTKTNVGPPGESLAYRLTADPATGGVRVAWEGPVGLTADDLCRPPRGTAEGPAAGLAAAEAWLRAELMNGPRKAADLVAAGRSAGHSERTLERAKKKLGVVSEQVRRAGRGEWYWADPSVPKPAAPEAPPAAPSPAADDPFGGGVPPPDPDPAKRRPLRELIAERCGALHPPTSHLYERL